MPKSPKPKKGEKSLEGKSSAKNKATKNQLSDSSKCIAELEDIVNVVIEDETWQCSTMLLVPQTRSLHDFLLQTLVNLPENFTVLTKDDIANTKDKTNSKKSRKGSKTRTSIRSTSKSSKQSSKSKATKAKNKSKKEVEKTEESVQYSSDELNSFNLCLALKKFIIGLKNTDLTSTNKNITDSNTNRPGNKIMKKDMRTRVSGDGVDSKTTLIEENLRNNKNAIHRFVILLGFYDPLLPEVLNKQNVPVKAVINVRNSTDDNVETQSNERPSTTTAKSKRKTSGKSKNRSVNVKVSNEYSLFLEKMVAFTSSAEFMEKCKNVAFLNYTIKSWSRQTQAIEFNIKSDLLGIFYKIKDAWMKYKVYTDRIQVQNLPTPSECLKLDDAKIYTTMISMVPLECTSPAVILHCILEQINWWSDEKITSDSSFVSDNNSTQGNSTSASKSFIKNKTPILIHHRDKIKYNTFHLDLPEFDFEQITTNFFTKSPVYKLWERYPPHPKPVQKWFEFQLQKLQNLNDNFILKLDHLFPIYLHLLLMDVLIFKTGQFTNSNDDKSTWITEPEMEVHQIFWSGKEPEANDSNSNLFIKEIIYNILCKVPNFSLCQNYAEVFELVPYCSKENTQSYLNQPVYTNLPVSNNLSKELLGESLLQKRELRKQEKLDKLLSFLSCSEFVNLYEDLSKLNFYETKRLEKYGFIEKLDIKTFCQSVQLAFQSFRNINYDYFQVTDSILLWFNNSVQGQVPPSCTTSKAVLETLVGFRDFYCHKLRESTEVGDVMKEDIVSRKSLKEKSDSFVDELKAGLESHTDYHSVVEENKKWFGIESSNPTIVYNLGSSLLESTESFSNYFSVDSSSVIVKRANYFNSKRYIVVNVNKNNTFVRYELDPESSNHFVQLFIDVHESLNLNCIFNWEITPEKSSIKTNSTEFSNSFETGKDTKFTLNCSLSITLPSGLFIEVVPTSSIYGPFYVRQRYLGKGPNCSSIWEEAYRCYFNNGMVLIFRVDDSVDILYNNGTTVKCHSLEIIKIDDLYSPKDNEMDANVKKESKKGVNSDLNQKGTLSTEEGQAKQQKKKGKVNADRKTPHSDVDGKKTNKESQKKKVKIKKRPTTSTENKEEKKSLLKETEDNMALYKVVQHSVLSWDGECSKYDTENCIDTKKCLSLRTAFDVINHELYWQRSDGMSSLQVPGSLTVKFPDGSKTTSFTFDNKELWVENNYVIIYDTYGDMIRVESLLSHNNTNSIGLELHMGSGDSNHKTYFSISGSDKSSIDSFVAETFEEKAFVYVENSFLMEHPNYVSVEYSNEDRELKLTLPGNHRIIVDETGLFSFKGDSSERITLFNDSLIFEANVLSSSTLSKSSTTLRFENVDTTPIIFSQTEDSFGNVFSVDERGNTTYLPSVSGENYDHPNSPLYSARFPQNTERLFVFNRDLTGYEIIHEVEQKNTLSNQDVQTLITPVVKDDKELYSLYKQSPVFKVKCEEYIMDYIEEIAPSLIKRKDLLKAHQTPEIIWFYPEISTVKKPAEENERSTAQPVKTIKAMMISHTLKVKKSGLNVIALFSKAMTKYMEVNEHIYQKYLNNLPKEILKEEDLVESEKNKMDFLGSKSYYLTDNLPTVITGEMAKENKSDKDIFSIFTPSVSKVSF